MKQSIKGKIRNFNLSNSKIYLFSIYEAISNSIHSIYINRIKNSKIDIIICSESQEIKSIEIIDYAEGFTKRNFETFLESEMTFKEEYGCKGVGRFVWLAGFKNVIISSKFSEDNKNYIRNFQFNESWDDDTPNENDTKKENNDTNNITSIKLLNPRVQIGFKKVKKDIIKHFLPQFFLLGEEKYNIEINIKYCVKDKKDKTKEEYDSINTKDFKYEKRDTFTLFNYKNEEKFNLYHVFTKDITNNKHEILLCAGFRVVQNSPFSNFPNDYIYDENKQKKFSSYHAVVCSDFLDKSVSLDRGNLSFPIIEYIEDEDYIKDFNPITNSMIIEKVKELSLEYLNGNKYTRKWDEDKESRIEKFKQEHAYLNPLLSLVNIDWSDSYEDIYKKVNQRKIEKENDIKNRIDKLVKTMENNDTDNFTTSKEFSDIIKDSSDINFLELSAYVYYRKYMLELFSKILKYKNKDTREYNREAKVHNFLYPMKETSDSIQQYKDHNLWIIDDRWSFYRYISSDRKMSTVIEGSELNERPDILLFYEDKENSLIDSILVVEIKRPGKPGKHDDPHLQVCRYITEISKHKSIKTSDGNVISISESPRFYSYILCDNANDFINDMCFKYGYEKTADGSYYLLKAKNNTIDLPTIDQYIIPFDVLLNTAKMRNKAFIDRLLK